MKVIQDTKTKNGKKITKVVEVCPVCGALMEETALNRDYCNDCAQKLKDNNDNDNLIMEEIL